MKRLTILLLYVSFFIFLCACEKGPNTEDPAKLQESIDKIKAKIQENLNTEKSS